MDRSRRTKRLIRKYGWVVAFVAVALVGCYVLLPTYRLVEFIVVAYLIAVFFWQLYGPRKRSH